MAKTKATEREFQSQVIAWIKTQISQIDAEIKENSGVRSQNSEISANEIRDAKCELLPQSQLILREKGGNITMSANNGLM